MPTATTTEYRTEYSSGATDDSPLSRIVAVNYRTKSGANCATDYGVFGRIVTSIAVVAAIIVILRPIIRGTVVSITAITTTVSVVIWWSLPISRVRIRPIVVLGAIIVPVVIVRSAWLVVVVPAIARIAHMNVYACTGMSRSKALLLVLHIFVLQAIGIDSIHLIDLASMTLSPSLYGTYV